MTNELNSDSMELMETTQARSLRTLQVKLIKIGAKVVRHSRYVIFQMAEVLISKGLFQEILERVHRLKHYSSHWVCFVFWKFEFRYCLGFRL